MVTEVISLQSRSPEVLIDTGVIDDLRAAVGDIVCREIVEDGIFQTTERLSALETALQNGDREQVRRFAHDLISVPGQIGMAQVSKVAHSLLTCCREEDWTAAEAVGARLLRVGEETLFSFPLELS